MKTKTTILAMAVAFFAGSVQAEEIIFAHGAKPGNPRYVASEAWASSFKACSGGIDVNVAASATMGDDVEMLVSASAGIINVTANSQGAMSQVVPEIGLLGLPFLFADLPTAWEVLDGDVGKMLDERAQNNGLKILGFWDNGIRHITHVEKNVPTPADVKGMKIRTPPDQMTLDIFEALDASPAPLAFSELPTALQSGVFDGQENPLTNIYSSKIHDITPFVTLTGHKYESTPVVVGMGWWSGLDSKTQGCLITATADAGKGQRQQSLDSDKALRPKMEADGATFAESDHQVFVAATASVYDKYAKDYPELVEALKQAAGH